LLKTGTDTNIVLAITFSFHLSQTLYLNYHVNLAMEEVDNQYQGLRLIEYLLNPGQLHIWQDRHETNLLLFVPE